MDHKKLYYNFLTNENFHPSENEMKAIIRFEEQNCPLPILASKILTEDVFCYTEAEDEIIYSDDYLEKLYNENYYPSTGLIEEGSNYEVHGHEDAKKELGKAGAGSKEDKAHYEDHIDKIKKHLETHGPDHTKKYQGMKHKKDGYSDDGREINSPVAKAQRKAGAGHTHIPDSKGIQKRTGIMSKGTGHLSLHYRTHKDNPKKITIMGLSAHGSNQNKNYHVQNKTEKWRKDKKYESWLIKFRNDFLSEYNK